MILGLDASRATSGQRTGTEAYAYFLIQALIPQAVARDHQLRLYYNQSPPSGLFAPSTGVVEVAIARRRLWTHSRLRAELIQRPPDVFFTPAHVIPVGYRGSCVVTIHDLGYLHFPEAHPRRQRAYLRWSTEHSCRVARRVIADSGATRDDLVRLLGVPPGKIDVVYPAADPELRPVDEATVNRALARYSISAPYFLYLGTLQPRKNLVRLIDAYAASGLAQASNNHELVLAGKAGWLAQPILDAIASQPEPVRARIRVTGYVDEGDKAALLSGATALAFPSLYEGFGFPILEAQTCGTAVLCSNTSSLPEVAGGAALLVDPLDNGDIAAGLRRLADGAAVRDELVALGRRNVARFSWAQTAARVLDTLEAAFE